MMMIPPKSGRKSVRFRNAALITEMSLLYSDLMSVWISEVEAAEGGAVDGQSVDGKQSGLVTNEAQPAWAMKIRSKVLALAEQTQGVRAQTATARFEGNIRGAWPAEDYNQLLLATTDMLASFFQVRLLRFLTAALLTYLCDTAV